MFKHIIVTFCLLMPLLGSAKEMAFSLVPKGELSTSISPHQSLTVIYTVTNTTEETLEDIGVSYAPTGYTPVGVTQISSVPHCLDPFTLKAGESCTLFLMIKADDLVNGEAIGGPEICNSSPSPIRCSIPKEGDELNIKVSGSH